MCGYSATIVRKFCFFYKLVLICDPTHPCYCRDCVLQSGQDATSIFLDLFLGILLFCVCDSVRDRQETVEKRDENDMQKKGLLFENQTMDSYMVCVSSILIGSW